MHKQTTIGGYEDIGSSKPAFALWNSALWLLALSVFAYAMHRSYQAAHLIPATDLRTVAILLLNASLATAVAFGFAARARVFTRGSDLLVYCRYGLWSAAVFRLLPPSINETGLYDKASGSFDVPYILLGAFIHGGLAVLLAWPFAARVFSIRQRPDWVDDQVVGEMCAATILVFYILAGAVRLMAEAGW